MSPRPLRQFYDHDRTFALQGLPPAAKTFRRHRDRFLASLGGLTDDEWARTTRCDAWDAKDVVNHLVSADGFWALTLGSRGNDEPSTFLRGFDPTASPEQIIAPRRDQPAQASLEALVRSSDQLAETLAAIGDDEWTAVSESPFGHVPVAVIAAHALWDSWLHERDVLLPLGRAPEVDDDELTTAAAFTLFLGGAQGGLLDDPEQVGDGPTEPIEATIGFGDDLPGRAFRVCVDRGVRLDIGDGAAATGAGSAVAFVEALTGRADAAPVLERLPADLAAQLARAREIL